MNMLNKLKGQISYKAPPTLISPDFRCTGIVIYYYVIFQRVSENKTVLKYIFYYTNWLKNKVKSHIL